MRAGFISAALFSACQPTQSIDRHGRVKNKMSRSSKFLSMSILVLSVSHFARSGPALDFRARLHAGAQDPAYVEEVIRLAKSAQIRNLMDENVDPCTNFYDFACGKWTKVNPANRVGSLSTGLLDAMSKSISHKAKQLLRENPSDVDTALDKRLKYFYESCLGLSRLTEAAIGAKLKRIIAKFAGNASMPALMGAKRWAEVEPEFDWLETVAQISKRYNIQIIIATIIMQDFENNTVNRVYVGGQDFPLESRSIYLDNHTAIYRTAYHEVIKQRLRSYLQLNATTADVTAREILDFEVALARGLEDEKLEKSIREQSMRTSVKEMQRRYAPTINIQRFMEVTFGETIDDFIYEVDPGFQANAAKVIARTPKRIIANYVYYMLMQSFLLETYDGRGELENACIDKAREYFSEAIDNMIYRHDNMNETEKELQLVWQQLKAAFRSSLSTEKLNWIHSRTRQKAMKKLDAMKMKINGGTDDDISLDELAELDFQPNDFIANLEKLFVLNADQLRRSLHEPPHEVNFGIEISYSPANNVLENTIIVPVAMLLPFHLWTEPYPIALKFGTTGFFIAHELIHGFDEQGRQFDERGNADDWWDTQSLAEFARRTRCFAGQYSKYVYNGRKLTYTEAQTENTADNGGLRLAYYAYMSWYNEAISSGQDMRLETLPNLNYTSKQLFFISNAQVWCNDVHPLLRDLQTSSDTHMPGRYRVIGPLSNFPEFAKEFQCAPGTPMNPDNKCEVY